MKAPLLPVPGTGKPEAASFQAISRSPLSFSLPSACRFARRRRHSAGKGSALIRRTMAPMKPPPPDTGIRFMYGMTCWDNLQRDATP
jgi:hypothetical protein